MNKDRSKVPPQAAFIAIGVAFMVIGMNGNGGLIGAGIVFLIVGIVSVKKQRNSEDSGDEPGE
jgi:hypothetical protein